MFLGLFWDSGLKNLGVSYAGLADGLTKRTTKHDRAAAETSMRTLASGLAALWLALAFSYAVCFGAWMAADMARSDGPTPSGRDALATAYTHMFGDVLSLRITWPDLLPSLEWLGQILDDPGSALEEVLERLSNVVRFMNFDPTYFLRGADALSAFNLLLG